MHIVEMIRSKRVKSSLLAGMVLSVPALINVAATSAYAQHDPRAIQQSALEDKLAWEIVEQLTTEIGSRMPGTEEEARARDWAIKKLSALGFANVHVEPFQMDTWVRGEESAEITAPFPHKMHITALGRSASTGGAGITAEIVYFETIDHLRAAPANSLTGKIAFINHDMVPSADGSSYGYFGQARFVGPNEAAKRGAVAAIIRSVGTDYHRNPHTGGTNFDEDVAPIPAGALSIPDAENLERILQRGQPVTMKLTLTPRWLGETESGNVIADIKGSDPSLGMIVLGCHLDSWDLATGAIDDASGCGIITATAKQIMAYGQPKRTIRLLWAGAEEVGLLGGSAYVKAHTETNHALVMESDFGAGKIWRVEFRLDESAKALQEQIRIALAPLGIAGTTVEATGGPDVRELMEAQSLAAIDLQQDGSDYFNLHHTPDDTLDKIDPKALQQNVAAWATVLSFIANHQGKLEPQNTGNTENKAE